MRLNGSPLNSTQVNGVGLRTVTVILAAIASTASGLFRSVKRTVSVALAAAIALVSKKVLLIQSKTVSTASGFSRLVKKVTLNTASVVVGISRKIGMIKSFLASGVSTLSRSIFLTRFHAVSSFIGLTRQANKLIFLVISPVIELTRRVVANIYAHTTLTPLMFKGYVREFIIQTIGAVETQFSKVYVFVSMVVAETTGVISKNFSLLREYTVSSFIGLARYLSIQQNVNVHGDSFIVGLKSLIRSFVSISIVQATSVKQYLKAFIKSAVASGASVKRVNILVLQTVTTSVNVFRNIFKQCLIGVNTLVSNFKLFYLKFNTVSTAVLSSIKSLGLKTAATVSGISNLLIVFFSTLPAELFASIEVSYVAAKERISIIGDRLRVSVFKEKIRELVITAHPKISNVRTRR